MGDDALRAAREMAADLDPSTAAARIGADWDEHAKRLTLPFLGSTASITYPDFEVAVSDRPAPSHIAALLVYHMAMSDGSLPIDSWMSFADLPNASFYVTAFRGYASRRIARHYSSKAESLDRAVQHLGGEAIEGLGDRAWIIHALPRVPIALLWWGADDEFEARAELLWDKTAANHLTTDGCAVLGSWLTSLLVAFE
ncbi:MAG: DUF3786 domain-containing protein [Actinomycetota bacterium]|jgi:hypothetical protein|nr:DUF3786 domain-containing protein [Actinomycetota bacterium]